MIFLNMLSLSGMMWISSYVEADLLDLTVDDLHEHVELVLTDLLADDVNILVSHQGNVEASSLAVCS